MRGYFGTGLMQGWQFKYFMQPTWLAMYGNLMRGLELNPNLVAVGATFVAEAKTAPCYRLWSIRDKHPGMLRASNGGASIEVEIWAVPPSGLATVLLKEPAGLSIGKITLEDGREVLGVLAEPSLCEGQVEITSYGGWRTYVAAQALKS